MKNTLKIFLLFVLGCLPIYAQNTVAITGTVTDTGGTPWLNAGWTATLENPAGGNPVFIDGTPVPLKYSGTLDSTGSFASAVVGNTSRILPFGTTWRIQICPIATASCQTRFNRAISAPTNIGTILSGLLAPLSISASDADGKPLSVIAYNIGEVTNPVRASQAYITQATSATCNIYAGGWQQCGGSTSPGSITPLAVGTVIFCTGASQTHGYLLNTPQLPNGGLTGNFCDDLSHSAWASKATFYNNGVTGATSAQILTNYNNPVTITDGNPSSTVTVPSPHSIITAAVAAGNKAYLILSGDMVGNDNNSTNTINNLTSIANAAQADGATVYIGTDYGHAPAGPTDNDQVVVAAILHAQIPSGPLGSVYPYIVDVGKVFGAYLGDTVLMFSNHPTLVGHAAESNAWLECMSVGVCANANSLGNTTYYQRMLNGALVSSSVLNSTGLTTQGATANSFAGITFQASNNALPLTIAYSNPSATFQAGNLWANTNSASLLFNHLWNGINVWTEDQNGLHAVKYVSAGAFMTGFQNVTGNSPYTIDAVTGAYIIAVSQNSVVNFPTCDNTTNGMIKTAYYLQGAGGFTVTYSSNVHGADPIGTTASLTTVQQFQCVVGLSNNWVSLAPARTNIN